jgi:Family of unknown function (DUF6441)
MQAELRAIERAVATGTREAGRGLRTELSRQVVSAGLGQRLANSWRDRHYPNQKLDAASLVYTKAPQIIRAFDEGGVIRSRRFLAIPTENAPRKGTDVSSSPLSAPRIRSALLADIDYSDRSCCSISAGSCPDQRSAARATSSRLRSFNCGTSRNITTVVRPCPLRRARSVARRKPLSWPVCLLNHRPRW